MIFIKSIFYILIIICLNFTNLYADDKINYIDLDSLVEKTNLGKKIINELKLINENNLNILKKKENEIKKIEDEINSQKNILSKDELKIKIEKYKKKVTEFKNNKNELVKDFNTKKEKIINNFFSKATPLINDYMNKNGINILLDKKKIFIANQDNNITSDIIDLINKTLK